MPSPLKNAFEALMGKAKGSGGGVKRKVLGSSSHPDAKRLATSATTVGMEDTLKTLSKQEGEGSQQADVGDPRVERTSPIATWLAGLDLKDAKALYRVAKSNADSAAWCPLSESDQATLGSLTACDSDRSGAWYLKFITCSIAKGAVGKKNQEKDKKKSGHARFQITTTAAGSSSIAGQLRAVLSKRAWETLKELPSHIQISFHWISYNADLRREAAPLPENCGAGGSLSHSCDKDSCWEAAHLWPTPVHRDNMDRQRCTGIRLQYFRGQIVREIPCKHGLELGETLETQILRSCTKLVLDEVSEDVFALLLKIANNNPNS